MDNFYKRLLDNASDLIWVIDMEGKITYINSNITDWGHDKKEAIGKPLLDVLTIKGMGKRSSVPVEFGVSRTFEMQVTDKSGELRRVVVSSSPLQNDDAKIIGEMGMLYDVTEAHAMEEKLKHEERLAALGRLGTGIAHEIRNPLSSIKMNLAILVDRLNPAGEDEEHFTIAQEEVINLERIVTEFIDYAKPSPLKARRQSLKTVIEKTLAVIKTVCVKKGVTITRDFPPTIPMALMDSAKIHQAILNILLNAIQASPQNGVVRIKVRSLSSPTETVAITIADNGKGIDLDDMKFVFDPFFTTKDDGTGMGLSIVRSIMTNHNGSVEIESDPGRETKVTLTLPTG
ncbi:hypothetical protein MNBD_NITROSPINAE01-1207 [hydrothermal vent metagenome]|uniref:Histidine kinase n=1 Tax=hydrothermal vent metagenome TaxID=652676 RepID=A0A3B1C963_9ZZZZ